MHQENTVKNSSTREVWLITNGYTSNESYTYGLLWLAYHSSGAPVYCVRAETGTAV